jgi:hypothetical protein
LGNDVRGLTGRDAECVAVFSRTNRELFGEECGGVPEDLAPGVRVGEMVLNMNGVRVEDGAVVAVESVAIKDPLPAGWTVACRWNQDLQGVLRNVDAVQRESTFKGVNDDDDDKGRWGTWLLEDITWWVFYD